MLYSFSLTSFSQSITKIQSWPIRNTVAKLGFKRTTAHAVIFGSPHYGGLGLRNLITEQGIAQATLLLRHLRAQSDIGRLALISLQWLQLLAGISTPILEDTTTPLPHLPPSPYPFPPPFLPDLPIPLTLQSLARCPGLPHLKQRLGYYLHR